MAEKVLRQYLKCEFTDAEVSDFGKELAAASTRRAQIEQQKKEIDSDLKAKIEAENTKIQRLSERITQGFEYRDVEVTIVLDSPRDGWKTTIRKDTGEEVKVEPMTDDDRQMALKLEEEAAHAEEKPKAAAETPDAAPETPKLKRVNGRNQRLLNGPPDSIDGDTRPQEPR